MVTMLTKSKYFSMQISSALWGGEGEGGGGRGGLSQGWLFICRFNIGLKLGNRIDTGDRTCSIGPDLYPVVYHLKL